MLDRLECHVTNKRINLFKAINSIVGAILFIVFDMDFKFIFIFIIIHSLLQSYQLRINKISSEVHPKFLRYFNVVLLIFVLISICVVIFVIINE